MRNATKADILLDLWNLARTLRVVHPQPEGTAEQRRPEPGSDAREQAGEAVALALAPQAAVGR